MFLFHNVSRNKTCTYQRVRLPLNTKFFLAAIRTTSPLISYFIVSKVIAMNYTNNDETLIMRERQCILNKVSLKQGWTFKMTDLHSFIS